MRRSAKGGTQQHTNGKNVDERGRGTTSKDKEYEGKRTGKEKDKEETRRTRQGGTGRQEEEGGRREEPNGH